MARLGFTFSSNFYIWEWCISFDRQKLWNVFTLILLPTSSPPPPPRLRLCGCRTGRIAGIPAETDRNSQPGRRHDTPWENEEGQEETKAALRASLEVPSVSSLQMSYCGFEGGQVRSFVDTCEQSDLFRGSTWRNPKIWNTFLRVNWWNRMDCWLRESWRPHSAPKVAIIREVR